jgi:hypothetical protein
MNEMTIALLVFGGLLGSLLALGAVIVISCTIGWKR